ncbi:MAG: tyrosine-protein phosphatase [Bacilli bacterium]|nr:tyrosine-protein phosphatase [Bacilli bacterium]
MIKNFRDFSRYIRSDGKRLKKGSFMRSAALVDINKKDIRFLDSVRPMTVIDLRSSTEAEEKPDYRLDNYHHISLIKDLGVGVAHDRESEKALMKVLPDMKELYKGFIIDEISQKSLKDIFSIVSSKDRKGSILWHCSVGKDRCGITSAIFLKLMGFSDDVVYADYLESAKKCNKEARRMYWIIRIFKRDKKLADGVYAAYIADKSYLDAAYDKINSLFGGWDNYLDALGLTKDVQEWMQNTYLE